MNLFRSFIQYTNKIIISWSKCKQIFRTLSCLPAGPIIVWWTLVSHLIKSIMGKCPNLKLYIQLTKGISHQPQKESDPLGTHVKEMDKATQMRR